MQQKRIMAIALGATVLVLAMILVLSTTQVSLAKKGGKGKITWSQNPVTATVAAGDTFSTTVSFTSTRDLNNVKLRVTPSLKATTVLSPTDIATVTAGIPYTVEVQFTAPTGGGRRQFNGNVHLRLNRKNNPDNLKLRFTVP